MRNVFLKFFVVIETANKVDCTVSDLISRNEP